MNDIAKVAEKILAKACSKVTPDGPSSWNIEQRNGVRLRGRATLESPWLTISLTPPRRTIPSLWKLLETHASSAGNCRFGLGRQGRLSLLADVAIPPSFEPLAHGELKDRVLEACAGLRQLAGRLVGHKEPAPASPGTRAEQQEAVEDTTPIGDSVREAGWECDAGSAGRLSVPLEVGDGWAQAILERHGAEQVHHSIEVAGPVADDCREGLASFLLTISSVVRFVRPVARVVDGRASGRLESVSSISSWEMDHALSALSVASGLSLRESLVLASDVTLGKRYLAARGWSRVAKKTTKVKTKGSFSNG